jgi:hypothetical protein
VKRLGAAAAAAVLAFAVPVAQAQEFDPDTGWEVGIRWWQSRGKTQWSHNAQGAAPFFGNPTSVLTYDKLDAGSLEIVAAKRFSRGFFLSGNLGGGNIHHGTLNDADYLAGQVKFSETNSSVTDGDLTYLTLDAGYDFLNSWRGSLGLFGGFNYWNERVVASGLTSVVPAGASGIPNNVAVITNDARWYSMRIGVTGRLRIGDSLNLSATVAAVPYTRLHNDDSHHLRSDLGPTPNITMQGNGYGGQAEAEARYRIFKSTDIGLGVRYWKLKATGDIQFAGSSSLPLNDFQSTRYGATLSFVSRW